MSLEFYGILVAIGGLVLTIMIFVVQSAAQVRLQKAEFVYRLNDKYDQICEFRAKHPEIIQYAESWSEKPLATMDAQERAYFYYAGMTLGFLEIAVYSTYVSRTLAKRDFLEFIRPMIVQEVSFNVPVFRHFACRGFISRQSRELLEEVLSEVEHYASNGMPKKA